MRPIWEPTPVGTASARIEAFRSWVSQERDVALQDYYDLQRWSVRDPAGFWSAIWDYFDVRAASPARTVLESAQMPGACWFPGARLNYVDQAVRRTGASGPALIDVGEAGGPARREFTLDALRRSVAALARTLAGLGVRRGDRVVGYLPNIAEAVVSFLATASLGAVWSCCGQDYAASAAASRLGQLEPVVLIAADGYRYGGKDRDRRDAVATLRRDIPSLRATIVVPRLGLDPGDLRDLVPWAEATRGDHVLAAVPVEFGDPLWVLFSSGTTGKPKGIVHGHGGVLLEHLKALALHFDLGPGDTFFWYTSPSWMMWNFLVAGLLVGSTVVCYDGSPSHPAPDAFWQLAGELGVTVLGTSPAYLSASEQAGLHPAAAHDLSELRILGVTGSVLAPASYHWAARELGQHVPVASSTGGTDVVSTFAGWAPTVPIWAGEISAPALGVALDAWDSAGRSVRDEVGELVVTQPMPSMPLYFWNDPDGRRYRDAYFEQFPGVWRHGDWITLTARRSVRVHGRSDSTLNRQGVRMGSADIYAALDPIPEVADSLVIGVEQADGGYWMPLFVVLHDGVELSPALIDRLRTAIRHNASPRHVPDEIIRVPAVPRTRTGKKLEVPIKRLMQGAALSEIIDPQAVAEAGALEPYVRIAETRRTR
jgi:acetoacetyl-CoA synthetase